MHDDGLLLTAEIVSEIRHCINGLPGGCELPVEVVVLEQHNKVMHQSRATIIPIFWLQRPHWSNFWWLWFQWIPLKSPITTESCCFRCWLSGDPFLHFGNQFVEVCSYKLCVQLHNNNSHMALPAERHIGVCFLIYTSSSSTVLSSDIYWGVISSQYCISFFLACFLRRS